MSERINRPEGIRDEVWQTLQEAENALAGRTSDEIPDVQGEPEFGGTVLDENTANPQEMEYVLKWLAEVMGEVVENLSVKLSLISADGLTRVTVYDMVSPGQNKYYLSKWVNDGERAAYVLWPWEMYEGQLEAGFEEEEK